MRETTVVRSGAALVLATAVLTLGCAKPPHKIEPAVVDPAPLRTMSCDDLGRLGRQIDAELVEASEKQQKAADKDAQGVFWFGVPAASASGEDIEDEVAQLKGKQIAIRQVRDEQCGPDTSESSDGASGEDRMDRPKRNSQASSEDRAESAAGRLDDAAMDAASGSGEAASAPVHE